ncbi:hypothetical protein EGW08_010992 [Elysia chlorotica]|uniref:Uncharacterized protein n=1 Tax=Elysia chlorotica TaxID=188477 RepID=A0A3S0ZKV8_ELYCH|nr:hypothetical protein EGW08_010992 [Elysia chlorotica]
MSGIEKDFKNPDVQDSISDYNKRMYSDLLAPHQDKELSFGPTAVTFRWKAGNPETQDVEDIHSRFGYGSPKETKVNNREINERDNAQQVYSLPYKLARKNQRHYPGNRNPWSKRQRKPVFLRKTHATKVMESDDAYSQNLGAKRLRTGKVSNPNSVSPFTPPPPDGDPDLLRIFPIYGNNRNHDVTQQNEQQAEKTAVGDSPSIYRPKSILLTSRAPGTYTRQPQWLLKAMNQRRKRLGAFRKKLNPNAGFSGAYENRDVGEAVRNEGTHDGRVKVNCRNNRDQYGCNEESNHIPESLSDGMNYRGKQPNQTSFYDKEDVRNVFSRDQGEELRTQHFRTSKGENIEALINLLALLLNEQAQPDRAGQNLQQRVEMRRDNTFPDDYDEGFSETEIDHSGRIGLDVFNSHNFQSGKTTMRRVPNSQTSWLHHDADDTFRTPVHHMLGNNRNEISVEQTESIQRGNSMDHETAEKPYTREADNTFWFSDHNRGNLHVSPDQEHFDTNRGVDLNRADWMPDGHDSQNTWGRESSQSNTEETVGQQCCSKLT